MTTQSRLYVNPKFSPTRVNHSFENNTTSYAANENSMDFVDDTDGSSILNQSNAHEQGALDDEAAAGSKITTSRYSVTNVRSYNVQSKSSNTLSEPRPVADSTNNPPESRRVRSSDKPPIASLTRRSGNNNTSRSSADRMDEASWTLPRARQTTQPQSPQQQTENFEQQFHDDNVKSSRQEESQYRQLAARPIDQYVNVPTVSRSAQTQLRSDARQQPSKYHSVPIQQQQDQRQFSKKPRNPSESLPPLPPVKLKDEHFPGDSQELRGETIEAVVIKRDTGLGLTIVGGENNEPLQVRSIVRGGATEASGVLQPGDVLVNINGMNVLNFTHDMIISVFKAYGVGQEVNIVACRGYPLFAEEEEEIEVPAEDVTESAGEAYEDGQENERDMQTDARDSSRYAQQNDANMSKSMSNLYDDNVNERAISIRKGSSGFGFTIEQSMSTGYQKIKKITDIGRCGDLREGDLLIQIDDEPLTGYTHDDIASILRHHPAHNDAVFWILRPATLRRRETGGERQSRRRMSMSLPRTRSRSISSQRGEQVAVTKRERSNSKQTRRPKSAAAQTTPDNNDEKRSFFSGLFGSSKHRKSRQPSSKQDDEEEIQPTEMAASSPQLKLVTQPKVVKKFEQIAIQKQTFTDNNRKTVKQPVSPKTASDRFRISSGGKPLPTFQQENVEDNNVTPTTFASTPQLNEAARPRSRLPVTNQLAKLVTPIFVTASRYTSPKKSSVNKKEIEVKPESQSKTKQTSNNSDLSSPSPPFNVPTTYRRTEALPAKISDRRSSPVKVEPFVAERPGYGIEKTNITTITKAVAPVSAGTVAKFNGNSTRTISSSENQQFRTPIDDTIQNVRVETYTEQYRGKQSPNDSQQTAQKQLREPPNNIRPWVPLERQDVLVETLAAGQLPTAARFTNATKSVSPFDERSQRERTTHQNVAQKHTKTDNENGAPYVDKSQRYKTNENLSAASPRPQQQQQHTFVGFEKSILLKSQTNGGFGFRVVGGSEDGSPVSVGYITPGGAADRDGRLRVGDELLAVDNKPTTGARHDETVERIRRASEGGMILILVLRRVDDITGAEPASYVNLTKPLINSNNNDDKKPDSSSPVGELKTTPNLVPVRIERHPVLVALPPLADNINVKAHVARTEIGVLLTKQPVEISKVTLSRHIDEGFGFVLVSSTPLKDNNNAMKHDGQQWIAQTQSREAPYQSFDSYPMVGKILPNTPADRCEAIKVGDRLLRVNNIDVYNFEHKRVVELIKNAGTTIILTTAAAAALPAHARSISYDSIDHENNNSSRYVVPVAKTNISERQNDTTKHPRDDIQQQQQQNTAPKRQADEKNRAFYSRISSYISARGQRDPVSNENKQDKNVQKSSKTTTTTTLDTTSVISDVRALPVDNYYLNANNEGPADHHYANIATRRATPAPPTFTTARAVREYNTDNSPPAVNSARLSPVLHANDFNVMYESVELPRGSHGFGFSLRGGKEFSSAPLKVWKIADNSPAAAAMANGGIRSGDEVVEINGVSALGLTHSEAVMMIRNGDETVRLLLKRRRFDAEEDGGEDNV